MHYLIDFFHVGKNKQSVYSEKKKITGSPRLFNDL